MKGLQSLQIFKSVASKLFFLRLSHFTVGEGGNDFLYLLIVHLTCSLESTEERNSFPLKWFLKFRSSYSTKCLNV